jgi:predicted AAA+ superfamily ATPase
LIRYIEKDLGVWRTSPIRKPLIVRGARQVGKTWTISQFGAREFKDTVRIDFEKRPDLIPLFDVNLEPNRILEQLEVASGRRIRPGETLLFLDEIQACPRAITALRYFYEELPSLHIIAAGSLLEFALGSISVPVGRVSYMEMFPMTFREYLLAAGNEPAAELLAQPPAALPETIHAVLLDALKRYFFVGGLPECVALATGGGSLLDVFSLQDDILNAYRDDFSKYAGHSDKACLNAVMAQTAKSVGQQIAYTRLAESFSSATNRKAFELLCQARVLNKIPSSSPAGLPLEASSNGKRFKASFLDIGLMQRLAEVPAQAEMRQDDLLAIWRGQLAEQFVAQELLASQGRQIYYWSREARGSQAEVDFLAVAQGKVHPVEVRSGAGGSLRSLHLALQTYPDCGDGLVFYSGPYGERPEQRLRFLPLYFAGSIN